MSNAICEGYIVINQLFLYHVRLHVISHQLNINTLNF